MRKSDWKREYRRARCGSTRADPRAAAASRNRSSQWELCAIRRAHWLGQPTMRAHKVSLIGDCLRALAVIAPRLP